MNCKQKLQRKVVNIFQDKHFECKLGNETKAVKNSDALKDKKKYRIQDNFFRIHLGYSSI